MKLTKTSIIIIFLALFLLNIDVEAASPKEKAHRLALEGIKLT
jgi:hypothetical protein